MKILALSDVHGDKHLIKEMAVKAAKNNVDLVLLAGDFIAHDGSMEGLVGPFKEKGIEVGIIPGNHESLADVKFLTEKYGVKNVHGYVLQKGEVGIFGCGYSNVGLHQMDEKTVFQTLKQSHDSLKDVKTKIMVTHTHPEGSVLGLGVFPGSDGVKKAIDEFKPDIHLCGHIHETEGIEEKIGKTRVINVGRKGKIIEV
jgi:Icc-related predicted phosphoesterase